MTSKTYLNKGRTGKRGAFINGVWHCDCDLRLPADKFQTKNGGKNHGRWFFTCQKSQIKRCGFFLWADEAKVREESAILGNSRSEAKALKDPPQTPRKPANLIQEPQTPVTKTRNEDREGPDSKAIQIEHEDSFDWSSSADEELAKAAQTLSGNASDTDLPREAARTLLFTSPGKRNQSDMMGSDSTWDDVFTTPNTASSNQSHGLLSPVHTPSKPHLQLLDSIVPAPAENSFALTTSVLQVLAPVHLPNGVENELVSLLNRYNLRTQGIAKGRDVARLVIQAKDKSIAELQVRIAGLEAERETCKTVIACLKQDIVAASPTKRPRRKSEV